MITNQKKDPDFKVTEKIKNYLEEKGASCVLDTKQALDNSDPEVVLVLGGDGTLLQAAREGYERNIPFIGVNLGTVGFLAEVETTTLIDALDALLVDRFSIEDRMMLDGVVCKEDGTEKKLSHALNDVVVSRQGDLHVLTYDVYVNGQFLNRYNADGLIMSTPTGSTGYNMSAGGPIVEPGAKLILLTPICPHTLSPRSIILSPEDQIMIEIVEGRGGEIQKASVHFDGSVTEFIQTGDKIYVNQSVQKTSLLRIKQSGFLENLHRKMG